jgi:hypothetical protein
MKINKDLKFEKYSQAKSTTSSGFFAIVADIKLSRIPTQLRVISH